MRKTQLCLMLLFLYTANSFPQNLLNQPESVVFDSVYNRYLVTNYGGHSVVQIDMDGNQSNFATGVGECLSSCLVGDVLYYTAGNTVYGLDLATGDQIWWAPVPTPGDLDGITADTSGNLYICDVSYARIIKINISTMAGTQFVTAGLPDSPQDVTYDVTHDRLLVCSYSYRAPIISISLSDSIPVQIVKTDFGYHDGIKVDRSGNCYVSATGAHAIYRYDSTFTNPPELIAHGIDWPTGMDYNHRDHEIAVGSFYDNQFYTIDMKPHMGLIGRSFTEVGGDMDGHLDSGEDIEILISVKNSRSTATNVTANLISNDSYIDVINASCAFASDIEWGGESTASSPFLISISEECPESHIVELPVEIYVDGDLRKTDTISIFIGEEKGFNDSMEGGLEHWRYCTMTVPYGNQWHIETFRTHDGTYSWKVGGEGEINYDHYLDAGLISPPFLLATNSVLRFWHWYQIHAASAPGTYDAAIVYLITCDGSITLIEPAGAYPYSTIASYSSSIPTGTPCFSGYTDWNEVEFDLSEFSGVAQLLFRFSSNGDLNNRGWYIDEISIVGDPDYICGDANSDLQANVGDAVFIINHVFKGGPAPVPIEAGDANCDDQCNVGDAVYLINHVFKGGPPPCAEC
ncbi:MAG: hypothetical protein ABIE07_01270 [Candidatus Zixiibacteriota bacterium]